MKEINIDGTNLILGRLSSFSAKELMKGNKVNIINSEKIIISGNKKKIIEKYQKKREVNRRGNPKYGPKFPRMPHLIVKMTIKGMIPRKKKIGKEAMKNLKCFIGIPIELKEKELINVKAAENNLHKNYITISELSKSLGAKW